MGMFDSLYIQCPKCNQHVEFQSKSGECICAVYTLENIPADAAAGMIGAVETCRCGQNMKLRGVVVLVPELTS